MPAILGLVIDEAILAVSTLGDILVPAVGRRMTLVARLAVLLLLSL